MCIGKLKGVAGQPLKGWFTIKNAIGFGMQTPTFM